MLTTAGIDLVNVISPKAIPSLATPGAAQLYTASLLRVDYKVTILIPGVNGSCWAISTLKPPDLIAYIQTIGPKFRHPFQKILTNYHCKSTSDICVPVNECLHFH